jgi:CheY-like chemotaxis protein
MAYSAVCRRLSAGPDGAVPLPLPGAIPAAAEFFDGFLFEACQRRTICVPLEIKIEMSQNTPGINVGAPAIVFIVDDEPMLLDLAAAILQPQGFVVRTFRDPRLAMEEFPVVKPLVVVTDYAMGEMNGMDLIRECRRRNPRQKIILLSGTVDEGIYANDPVKPDYFLAKPYQVQTFIELVRKLAAA